MDNHYGDFHDHNHKTVFVLDHTPYFGISCENPIEFEFLKARGPGCLPIPPFSKSLWTCSFESALEYCRIVWDLFPINKLIRFVASDHIPHCINEWLPAHQNLGHLTSTMSTIGVPPTVLPSNTKTEFTVLHGMKIALEALNEPTEAQLARIKSDIPGKLINRGRVICITSTRDDESMNRLEEIFLSGLMHQNKVATKSDRLLVIDHCHLVIINTFPANVDSQVSNHTLKSLSPILSTEVHSVKANLIPNKLSALILEHYDLTSTTVTGIPMKEEQNASSSANYDVEIYHHSSAHTAILKSNASDSLAIQTQKENHEYLTVTLKWCTPRGTTGSELHNCTRMHRITPVDVNSRPSLCLINFLLNGRSVMLEMPRKSGGKITSHLLAAHGGEIYIHTLCTARSVLEDPPSISEGCGGRVTDYRITDFGMLMKQNALLPVKSNTSDKIPINEMVSRLNRMTRYWPLTISSTLIFNLKMYIDPLPSIITKETITEEEVNQCKQIIRNLISLENKHESLHPMNTGQRVKGQKRDEQYKTMWNELDILIKNNLHSEAHKTIHKCLLESHAFKDEKVELDEALRELDQIGPSKPDLDAQRASVIRATTDSPMSPPPLSNIASASTSRASGSSSNKNLYDMFLAMNKPKSRPEFAGRMGDGLKAKLYPNLKADRNSKPEGMDVD